MDDKPIVPTGIRIRKLPFYWRVNSSPREPNIVPAFLPLELEYDTRLGLFQQKRNRRVLKSLTMIYQKEPNIGHNQEASNWKYSYGNDLYSFIQRSTAGRSKKPKRILEIGAGGCVILEKFKSEGNDVLGIDPSPFSRKEGRKKEINVICDFYPSKKITGAFDLIYHSNVLEHINDPVRFLTSQCEDLNDGGLVVFAVPDCTGPLVHGDISVLYHQHLTFFTRGSLAALVARAGFVNVSVQVAGYGGNLYCVARKGKSMRSSPDRTKHDQLVNQFIRNHNKLMDKISRFILDKTSNENTPLGIYAPLRVLPYLATLNRYKGIRFFDDTSYWHRMYFDVVPIMIEDFDDLKRNPVADVLIMSPTFENIIAGKIRSHFGSTIRIAKITGFYE